MVNIQHSKQIGVRRVGTDDWTAPECSSYADEKQLQEVVAGSPHWVSGVPDGASGVRESLTSAGPIDVMIVAPEGGLTAVECVSCMQ